MEKDSSSKNMLVLNSRALPEYQIKMSMYLTSRNKLIERMRQNHPNLKNSVILLEGGKSTSRFNTDFEHLFRQESNFKYLFGVDEPDCYGIIDLRDGKCTVFFPRLPEEYATWMGTIHPISHFKKLYELDETRYEDELGVWLEERKPDTICLHKDDIFPSKDKEIFKKHKIDRAAVQPELDECRLIKSPEELNLLRYVNAVSSHAHIQVMKAIRPGMKEYELEALFLFEVYRNGRCRHPSYTCICGTADSAATLHTIGNERIIKDGVICLFDMGGEFNCYCSDITCSFPSNGKFTEEQKMVYTAVWEANKAVRAAAKPGVAWEDMHRLANKVILQHLLKAGLIKGELQELIDNHIGALFFPHGLGHFLGLDTHDVAGYPEGVVKLQEPGIKYLRFRRVLQEGMFITIEPGCYFISANLEPAFKNPETAKYLNEEKIRQYMGFGGVRIEDDVLVTADGIEVFTQVPREIEDIERVMKEGRDQEDQIRHHYSQHQHHHSH